MLFWMQELELAKQSLAERDAQLKDRETVRA